jgi:cardiolipin synthase
MVSLLAVAGCAPAPLGGSAPVAAAPGARLLVSPAGPLSGQAAAEGTGAVLEAIAGARARVRLAMYLFTAPDALAALAAARAAGRQIEVLLERTPYGDEHGNEPAFAALLAAGVDVRWVDAPRGLLHAKLLIVDGACAYVMTLNFTRSGLGANREYAVVDCLPADVRRADELWAAAALGADEPPAAPGNHLVASPWNARPRLTAAIDAAGSSIDVEMEELSDAALVSRLEAAQRRGVQVTLVAPARDRSAATDQALARLAGSGVAVRVLESPGVHAKAMVIDRRLVYVGSVNFTRASLDDNREVGWMAEDPAMAARVRATIATDALGAAPLNQ